MSRRRVAVTRFDAIPQRADHDPLCALRTADQVAADLRRAEFLRPEGLLPVAAVAKRLGLSAATVHEAINTGKLRSVLFGSVRRVRQEDLDAYARLRGTARPPADETWCTVLDVVRATGFSRSQTYRLIARGALPFYVFAGTKYITARTSRWLAGSSFAQHLRSARNVTAGDSAPAS